MKNNKGIYKMTAVILACTLTVIGFTSQAASPQKDSVEGQIPTLHTLAGSAVETTGEKKEEVAEELARRQQEAKERAEREAREKAEREARQKEAQKLLAAIIFCEAGNQPYEGQVAVGAVVMNRVQSGSYPNSIESVIYQRGQFGPAATGWLNKVRNSGGYNETNMKAAADALAGADPVDGCLYFDKGGRGRKIGDHYFH